jgi:L-cysteine S-thiosulfotransferase
VKRSRPDWPGALKAACAVVLLLPLCDPAQAQFAPYVIENGAIPAPLLGLSGDPARGRVIVANRQKGLCLLCHSGPIPEERFQGDLAPSLAGAGSRSTEGELRLRMVDSRRVNPESVMPAYHAGEGLTRVGQAFAGKPILTAQEIEDVVAYLKELRE